jgi:septal ring factor EnvC (AmiA/AmiB activator)
MRAARVFLRILALGAFVAAPAASPRAQQEQPRVAPADPAPAGTAETLGEKEKREADLKAVEDALGASAEARRTLEAEIAGIRTDRARLNAALIDTADRMRGTEERVRALEQRLATLAGSEAAIRRSLESRRDVIVEVFAALQRMGRRPAPAVLVRPEDMLEAVRASILLGEVLPELRAETETLAIDLAELVRLKNAIAQDRATLAGEAAALTSEQERIAALMQARQQRLAEAEKSAGAETERAAGLARQAGTLKELIDRLERDIAASRRAAEEARRAEEARAKAAKERFAEAAFRDPARLSPKVAFPEAKGLLPRPVSGPVAREFGAADGYGGVTRGISIRTRPRSLVVSPSDGWVAFAGPFRSYGRLLIINAGGGYYLLLAGMERINVEMGQFVLAGEPVAVMGQASSQSPAAGAIESSDPVLYVEFRKDGGSIDPGPWWAKSQSEKVRG